MDVMEARAKSAQLLEESKMRRSYRKFLPEALDLEVLRNCIKTAATAPSGANKQPWHFCLVTNQDVKDKIREEADKVEKAFYESKITDEWAADLEHLALSWQKPFLNEAPALIVIFKEYYKTLEDGTKDKNYYVSESADIATGLLINALRNVGLQTLTYTPAPNDFLKEMFGRPDGEKAVMVLVVGKPDPEYDLPEITHKDYEEIVTEYL